MLLNLKIKIKLRPTLSAIWGNTDGCTDQYICASALYLMLVLSQCSIIIIDRSISATDHDKEVVDVLNSIDKL